MLRVKHTSGFLKSSLVRSAPWVLNSAPYSAIDLFDGFELTHWLTVIAFYNLKAGLIICLLMLNLRDREAAAFLDPGEALGQGSIPGLMVRFCHLLTSIDLKAISPSHPLYQPLDEKSCLKEHFMLEGCIREK